MEFFLVYEYSHHAYCRHFFSSFRKTLVLKNMHKRNIFFKFNRKPQKKQQTNELNRY